MTARDNLILSAVERLVALRKLTRETGSSTKRSQNSIIQALPDDVLAEVSVRIYRQESAENGLSAVLSGEGR